MEKSDLATSVNDIISAAAAAFPEIAGKGFEYYVSYVFAKGVSGIVTGVVSIVAAILFALAARKMYKICTPLNEGEVFISIILIALGIMFAISGLHSIENGIIYTLAPQGAVLHEIIGNMKGK